MPSIRLAELHPIVVHFPIALLFASVALDVVSLWIRRLGVSQAATWCLVLGVPGAGFALLSGWISERGIEALAPPQLLHLHKVCAVLTTVVFGTLLLVRLMWVSPQLMQFIGALVPRAQPALAGAQQRLYAALPGLDSPHPSRLLLVV
jgi:uncharacterized membrane protein